jgi:hypothetical protein
MERRQLRPPLPRSKEKPCRVGRNPVGLSHGSFGFLLRNKELNISGREVEFDIIRPVAETETRRVLFRPRHAAI